MAECLDVREPIPRAIQKRIQRIIIQSDSHIVVNAINGKMGVPKEIIDLVEDNVCLIATVIEEWNIVKIGFLIGILIL